MYQKEIYYYGSPEPNRPPRNLRAGPLSVQYEHGFLRYIKLGNVEVLRMIYHAVRDHNWDTMAGKIFDEVIKTFDDSFHITYRWKGEAFTWDCDIKGMANGEIIFEIEGQALKRFQKNRTGFCILHPIKECAGNPCEVTHPDGSTETFAFPEYISPHQPFLDIQSMQWGLTSDCQAHLNFEGDIFEIEDQRNWTDDSYKTYCTPLSIPFPVDLEVGTVIKQVTRLSLSGDIHHIPKASANISLSPHSGLAIVPPEIGIEQARNHADLEDIELLDLAVIPFDHYRVEIRFDRVWREHLKTGIGNAEKLGFPLELVLIFSDQFRVEFQQLLEEIGDKKGRVKHILLLHQNHSTTPQGLIEEIYSDVREAFHHTQIGAGTNAYFTHLNRSPIKAGKLNFISYSLNPQVHAFDHASLTENLSAQGTTAENARMISKGLPIHISPITLRPRFNPDATGQEPTLPQGTLPDRVDPRQMSLYGAGWTLGSIIHLAEAGAKRITYFQTVGMEGIMQGDKESEVPDKFYAQEGMRFPMWYIFHQVLRNKFMKWIPLETTAPLQVKGIFFQLDHRHQLMLANYSAEKHQIEVHLPVDQLNIFHMDEHNVERAMTDPHFLETESRKMVKSEDGVFSLEINPFGIVFGE